MEELRAADLFELVIPTFGLADGDSGLVFKNRTSDEMNGIVKKFNEKNIGARLFWMPISYQPKFKESPKFEIENSHKIWNGIVALPCSTSISRKELMYIQEIIKEIK